VTRLGDVWGERLTVDCSACRRHGSYRLDRLMEQYGAGISTLDLLRALTSTCRHQRGPGAKVARKYESQCLAMLKLAKAPDLEPPVPPGRPFTVEVWAPRGGSVEMRLAVIYPLTAALAAFDAIAESYPDREVTLRQLCHVIRRRSPPGSSSPNL